MKQATKIVDLKSAHLQIHVDRELWRYQLVQYKSQTYCLTRLGFGLSSAPKIMTAVLRAVLKKDGEVEKATSSYIDDILVEEVGVSAENVKDHVGMYGLIAKPPEPLENGAALGLRLQRSKAGKLVFSRGNEVPVVTEGLTKGELYLVCGKLVGHYPIASLLRVACSYIKRRASEGRWADRVSNSVLQMIKEVIEEVRADDPVRGEWYVGRNHKGVIWCDASSLALGVPLEIGGVTVEDAAWLRKKSDCAHINIAELEAATKGVNLALKWGLRELELKTDSAIVASWIGSLVSGERRVRTKGVAELLVKRRLGVLRDLVCEFGLELVVLLIPSQKNRADVLTRV